MRIELTLYAVATLIMVGLSFLGGYMIGKSEGVKLGKEVQLSDSMIFYIPLTSALLVQGKEARDKNLLWVAEYWARIHRAYEEENILDLDARQLAALILLC